MREASGYSGDGVVAWGLYEIFDLNEDGFQEVDGNDIGALLDAYDVARQTKGKPSFIKANTMMGKGVASLEGLMFHQLRFPEEVANSARAELEAQL